MLRAHLGNALLLHFNGLSPNGFFLNSLSQFLFVEQEEVLTAHVVLRLVKLAQLHDLHSVQVVFTEFVSKLVGYLLAPLLLLQEFLFLLLLFEA